MTLADFASTAEHVLTIIALLGAIWSAGTFVKKLMDDKENARKAQLAKWRMASVQKIMTTSPNYLTAKQITDMLRSSSFETEFEVEKDELSEEVVRLLLVEMVTNGILFQIYGDAYGLQQQRLYDPGLDASAEFLRNHRATMRGIDLISEYSAHFDDSSLYKKLASEGHQDVSFSGFRSALYDAENRGLIATNDEMKWVPSRPQNKAMM